MESSEASPLHCLDHFLKLCENLELTCIQDRTSFKTDAFVSPYGLQCCCHLHNYCQYFRLEPFCIEDGNKVLKLLHHFQQLSIDPGLDQSLAVCLLTADLHSILGQGFAQVVHLFCQFFLTACEPINIISKMKICDIDSTNVLSGHQLYITGRC